MGYVPPIKNETAVNYGSRMVEQRSSIHKVHRIEPPAASYLNRRERKAYGEEERRLLLSKRRKVEQQLYGKGFRFDVET
ncbi:hypothetical protein [Bacillus piscicola]|uniref:hypothetical protein n=1 Tax=Bacillus piscicola TaxID=1632684 RepID=UPI001F09683A|nr:hypothetical protein [Bacillus piscicola]